jgi:hypothetical protein
MPGQITHFYLASRLAENFDGKKNVLGKIADGFKKWKTLNEEFQTNTNKAIKNNSGDEMQEYVNKYRSDLFGSYNIALFSAFTAGAVGPDIWTMLDQTIASSESFGGIKGSYFFDMGHYNLSHVFPKYVLRNIIFESNNIQKEYQTAYIMGYISHICLDILVHLQVNVFAGAYHQQKADVWETDQGYNTIDIFNNHNKVEQYLDAFIRFFCFEGFYTDKKYKTLINFRKNAFAQQKPWFFPNYNDHYSKIMKFGKYIKTDGINNSDILFLNLTTSLPGIFFHYYSDKVKKSEKVVPFIRKYFLESYYLTNPKDHQGEPHDYLDARFKTGAKTLDKKTLKDGIFTEELLKLKFFSMVPDSFKTKIATDATGISQHYYLHYVIPNLEKVLNNSQKFFSLESFGDFINKGAIPLAESFIEKAMIYTEDKNADPKKLEFLDNWNLDIGMRIKIKNSDQKLNSESNIQVPAVIDIEHVLDLDLPNFKDWKIVKQNKIISKTKSWDDKPKAPKEKTNSQIIDINLNTVYKVQGILKIGIGLKVRNTDYHKDGDIAAYIYGNSDDDKKDIIGINKRNTIDTYKGVKDFFEDFKTENSSILDGSKHACKTQLYHTTFLGLADKDSKKPNLDRHLRIVTCRKFVGQAEGTGVILPEKLSTYTTVYPSEEVLISLFVVLKKEEKKYFDIFQKCDFTDKELDEIKKIKTIGVNSVLLILDMKKDHTVILKEAYVDGEKQYSVK